MCVLLAYSKMFLSLKFYNQIFSYLITSTLTFHLKTVGCFFFKQTVRDRSGSLKEKTM